jgi:hypothetical protein
VILIFEAAQQTQSSPSDICEILAFDAEGKQSNTVDYGFGSDGVVMFSSSLRFVPHVKSTQKAEGLAERAAPGAWNMHCGNTWHCSYTISSWTPQTYGIMKRSRSSPLGRL